MVKIKRTKKSKGAETFIIKKGLTREQARKLTQNRITRDHRGFVYNPRTGRAVWT